MHLINLPMEYSLHLIFRIIELLPGPIISLLLSESSSTSMLDFGGDGGESEVSPW
jgi:hypothetical protein